MRHIWIFPERTSFLRNITPHSGWAFALFLLVLQGCVIIPTPGHRLRSGLGEIAKVDMEFLEVGKTTREEVLLRFGDPKYSLNNGNVFAYAWTTVRGYYAWGVGGPQGPGTGGGGTIWKTYLVLLEFDKNSRLKRFEQKSSSWPESSLDNRILSRFSRGEKVEKEVIDEWTLPGSEKLVANYIPIPKAQPDSPLATVPPTRLKIEDFRDERPGGNPRLVGKKIGPFGGDNIYLDRRVSSLVQKTIGNQWKAAGHKVVDNNQNITISGQVNEFKFERSPPPLWKRVGVLDVTLEVKAKGNEVKSITRRYQSRQTGKSILIRWTEPRDIVEILGDCLSDLMHQMATDEDLTTYLNGLSN